MSSRYQDDGWYAVANYATGRWENHQLNNTLDFLLTGQRADYVSPAGRFYVALLASPNEQDITAGRFVLDDGSPLPAPVLTAVALPGGVRVDVDGDADLRAQFQRVNVTGPGADEVWDAPLDGGTYFFSGLQPGQTHQVTGQTIGKDGGSSTTTVVPQPGWEHTWAAFDWAEANAICTLADGSLLAGGISSIYAPGSEEAGLLMHLSASGAVLKASFLPGLYITGIAPLHSGAVITGSMIPDTGSPFVARVDADGTVQWARSWPCKQGASNPRLTTDAAGNVYLAATCRLDAQPGQDVGLLAKLGADGSVVWQLNCGVDSACQLADVAIASDGAVFAGGRLPDGSGNGVLFKFDAAGEALWQQQWHQYESGGITSMAADANGGCFAGANGNDPDGYGYLLHADSSGHLLWVESLTGIRSGCFTTLRPDGLGGVWAAGSSRQSDDDFLGLLTHWAPSGTVLQSNSFQGFANYSGEGLTGLAVTASSVYLSGQNMGPGDGWDDSLQFSTPVDEMVYAQWTGGSTQVAAFPLAATELVSGPVLQGVELWMDNSQWSEPQTAVVICRPLGP